MAKNEKITDIVPVIQYIGNGTTTVFPFPFMVFKQSDVNVYVDETKVTTGFHFEIIDGIHGGNVIFAEAPIKDAKITITRILNFETLAVFTDGGYLLPTVLNTEFNHLVGLTQQLKSDISRCMMLPVYIQNVNLSLPPPISGRAIIWNNQGTELVNSVLPFNTLALELEAATQKAQENAENSQQSAVVAKESELIAIKNAQDTQDGVDEVAGIIRDLKGFAIPIFFNHHFDSLLNDASWLSADTFSWHSGKIYWAAYDKLVEDFTRTIATTETVADIAITYYRTETGKKICLPNQENQIMALYATTGAAWYYILDTENKQFKLPRKSKRELLYNGSNSNGWYEVYSDGWLKQGGILKRTSQLVFSKPFKDNLYIIHPFLYEATLGFTRHSAILEGTKTASGLTVNMAEYGSNPVASTAVCDWAAEGYGEVQPRPDSPLYFYVGNTLHDAQDIYAGKALEQLAGKADVDFSNISELGILKIVDNLAIDYSKGVVKPLNGFVANQNGFLSVQLQCTGVNAHCVYLLVNGKNVVGMNKVSAFAITFPPILIMTGDVVTVSNGGSGAVVGLSFYPLKGVN